MSFTIIQAQSAEDLSSIKTLFQAYAVGLGLDISFQNFDHELVNLPGKYAPPSGALLLAKSTSTGKAIGPEGRGTGVGKALAEAVVAKAKRLGYARMVLDTLGSMVTPLKLYRGLGFKDIEPYYHNPLGDVIFLELILN
ncbi:hypothetical protein MBLNU13_g07621t1 [Cladosporium sp. NU13]